MKEKLYILFIVTIVLGGVTISRSEEATAWQAPFDTSQVNSDTSDSALTLTDVLNLVSLRNPTFRALSFQEQSAFNSLWQAGLWPNPEVEAEFEEVGWDAPGLRESEITMSVSQEFELFGQRDARKQVARAGIEATRLQSRFSAFDLYLETKRRFYTLVHAQEHLSLTRTSVALAKGIVDNINFRINKGAALQSESLLAQLEKQRVQLMLEQAEQAVTAARASLVSLWGGHHDDLTKSVHSEPEPQFSDLLKRVNTLESKVDSSRGLLQLHKQSALLRAEESLAAAEARPTLTLSGGYKRIEADNSNSFVFGVSMPVPFFNRNQGTQAGLRAQTKSLEYEMERARLETFAEIRIGVIQLRQLIERHQALDTLLLPTAEQAYQTLQTAYKAGRVPYAQLLEGERSLNEL